MFTLIALLNIILLLILLETLFIAFKNRTRVFAYNLHLLPVRYQVSDRYSNTECNIA